MENASLLGGGYVLKQNIWNSARDSISEWTGQELAECSLYGIRVYETGAMLVSVMLMFVWDLQPMGNST